MICWHAYFPLTVPQGTLLTLIGGPDAGRVDWHPSVIAAAAETGLSRSEAGDLEVTA